MMQMAEMIAYNAQYGTRLKYSNNVVALWQYACSVSGGAQATKVNEGRSQNDIVHQGNL
jgi:hypothetical protein